jgi:hypothetical protein
MLILESSELILIPYSPFTGSHFGYSHVVFVDEAMKEHALTQQSAFKLHGKSLAVGTTWLETLRTHTKPSVLSGWWSSSSSSSSSVLKRNSRLSPLSSPQDLLQPIREGRQVRLGNLPNRRTTTPGSYKDTVMGRLYELLHSYDVEAVSGLRIKKRMTDNGVLLKAHCFINFAEKEDAETALSTLRRADVFGQSATAMVVQLPPEDKEPSCIPSICWINRIRY